MPLTRVDDDETEDQDQRVDDEDVQAQGEDEDEGQDQQQQEPAEGEVKKPKGRRDRRTERAAEGPAILELKRQNQELSGQLREALEKIGRSTAAVADAVTRQSEPKPKPLRETIKERLRGAAGQVRAREEDGGASQDRYFDEQAAVVEEAAREVARDIVRRELEQFQRAQPQQMSPEDARVFAMAPWMDPRSGPDGVFNFEGVKREVQKLRVGNDMTNPTVFRAVVDQAVASWAKRQGLDLYGAPRSSGSPGNVSGMARSPSFAGGNGEGGGPKIPYDPAWTRLADEHPDYRNIKPQKKRWDKFRDEIIIGEGMKD